MSDHTPSQFLDLDRVPSPPPSTADHSPLPWEYCGCGKCGLIWSIPADFHVATAIMKTEDGEMTAEQRQANAEFIVKACNAYDQLVSAINMIFDFDEKLNPYVADILRAAIASTESSP